MGQKTVQPYTLDRVVRLLLSALAFGGALYLLYLLRNILLPFFVAWLLAYLLNPIVRFFERRLKLAHSLAVILTLFCGAAMVVLLGLLLVPLMHEEIGQINAMISNYEISSISHDGVSVHLSDVIDKYVDFKQMRGLMSRDNLLETIQNMSPALEKLLSNTISFILGFTVIFIVMLYLIFIMLDYDKINELWRYLIPPKYRPLISKITNDVEKSMNTYFRYQTLICMILSVLYAVGFHIIGLPLAIIFGIFVGLIHMIPYLQVITLPPVIMLCWLRASQTGESIWVVLGLAALVYMIVQCILDLFLIPKIMGKAMGLNPAIILLSLSVWGFFFGIIGMIIAIPMTTLLLSYYREFIAKAEQLQNEGEKSEIGTDGN